MPSATPSTAAAEPSPARKKKKRRKASLDISKYEDLDVQTFLAKKEQLHSPTIPPRPVPSISGVIETGAQPDAESEAVVSASRDVIVLDTPSPHVPPVVVKPEPQETTIPRSKRFTPAQHEVIDLTLSEDEGDHMAVDQVPVHAEPQESNASIDVEASAPPVSEPGPRDELSTSGDAQPEKEPPSEVTGPDQRNESAVEPIAAGQGDEDGEEEMELGSESSRQVTLEATIELDAEPAVTPIPSTPAGESSTPKSPSEAGPEAVEALSSGIPSVDESSAGNAGESHESNLHDPSSMNVEQTQQAAVPATLTPLANATHESNPTVEECAGMDVEQDHENVPTPLSQTTQSGELSTRFALYRWSVAGINYSLLPAGIYGNDMQVMALERGMASKSRLTFGLNVDEQQYKLIMTWTEQTASIP